MYMLDYPGFLQNMHSNLLKPLGIPVPIPTTKRKCIRIIRILGDGDRGWSH